MDSSTAWRSEILVTRSERIERSVYAERTDRQLVELTLAGDASAFECIFDRHKRYVAIVASRYFSCPHQIEEVIQASFTKAYFELASFRGANELSLVSWLGRITATTCLNILRSRRYKFDTNHIYLSDDVAETLAVDLVEKSAEELTTQRDLLKKLLASLDAEDRAVLQMLYVEEMTASEIAELFGWSRAKVKVRAFRARHTLRRILRRFL
jgi:RNA polymerase sigma-70 factor (ECF subfamily)